MTETEAQAARRLERMSEELHIDAALHSDPCATGLQLLVHAIETHIAEEEESVEAYRHLANGHSTCSGHAHTPACGR